MKTFSHPHFPPGYITDAETLRSYVDAGEFKINFILDGGELMDNSSLSLYLKPLSGEYHKPDSTDFYIHSEQGFIWWMSHQNGKVVMANRTVELTFYTHDEPELDDYCNSPLEDSDY
jgi:hypothetical protein